MTYGRVDNLLEVLLALYLLVKNTESYVFEIDDCRLRLVEAYFLFHHCEDFFEILTFIRVDIDEIELTALVFSYLIWIVKITINSFEFKYTPILKMLKLTFESMFKLNRLSQMLNTPLFNRIITLDNYNWIELIFKRKLLFFFFKFHKIKVFFKCLVYVLGVLQPVHDHDTIRQQI